MKKTYNGCKASDRRHYGNFTCNLNYKVESIYSDKIHMYIDGKPLEECPKPKTNDEYIKLNPKEEE